METAEVNVRCPLNTPERTLREASLTCFIVGLMTYALNMDLTASVACASVGFLSVVLVWCFRVILRAADAIDSANDNTIGVPSDGSGDEEEEEEEDGEEEETEAGEAAGTAQEKKTD